MIAAESKLFTYVEAAEVLRRSGSDAAKKKFIQRRVSSGKLIATKFGKQGTTPLISELDLQDYKNNSRAVEKTKRRK